MRAELAVDCRNHLGEGLLWSNEHRLLMWTDIDGMRIWTLEPRSGAVASYRVPDCIGTFAPRAGRPFHEIVAAFAGGFGFCDLLTGVRTDVAAVAFEVPTARMNDGRTDRQGRLVAGGVDNAGTSETCGVHRLDPSLAVTRLFGGVICANSTCFSPDGRLMYFADSPKCEIVVYDYDTDTGTPSNRRLFAKVDGGFPDGSCVDAEGHLWNAVWEGYRVDRYAPDGKRVQTIDVPVKKPACCAFGGPDLATLYITTARESETAEDLAREPAAGSLYAAIPGVGGLPDTPFAG